MKETELFGHEKFVCYWRPSLDNHVTEIHGADFFTKENGYYTYDIEELANLLIGESADLSHPTQVHYVLRIN